MPVFEYKAKTKKEEIKEGILVAVSKKEAGKQLRDQQLSPLSVKKTNQKGKGTALFGKKSVDLVEKANLCRYLARMINSGLSLSESVEVIAGETTTPAMSQVLEDVQTVLQSGQPLSYAFSKHPEAFDEVFLTLVKAGEESGTLGKTFEYLGNQLHSDYELGQRIKGTLAYPIVVVLSSGGLGLAMLLFVVPKISPVLLNLSREFPLPSYTLIILKVSLFFSKNVFLFLGSLAGLGIAGFLFLAKPKGKRALNIFLSRMPFFGDLLQKLMFSRFNRTLSTLFKSGVPITTALSVAAETLTLPKFKKAGINFVEEIEKGVSLSAVLKKTKIFPSIMVRMVATGEKTGSLDKFLFDLAQFYEEEVSNSLKTLTSIIEPVMMLGIGIGVAVMVVSVIAPIYSFVGSLSAGLGGS